MAIAKKIEFFSRHYVSREFLDAGAHYNTPPRILSVWIHKEFSPPEKFLKS